MNQNEADHLNEVDFKTQEEKSYLQLQALSIQLKQENKSISELLNRQKSYIKESENHLKETQTKLDDANGKYRTAVEQIATYKERIVSEETGRIRVQSELEEIKSTLELERGRFGAEIEQLRTESQVKAESLQRAEKELIKTESELTSVKERLNEANNKYRIANEQIATFKERIDAEGERYIGAVEQIATYKERIVSEETGRIRVQSELEEIKSTLELERGRFGAEIEQLRTESQVKAESLQRAEKELIKIESERISLKELLNDANNKYRIANEQIFTLKDNLKNINTKYSASVEKNLFLQDQLSDSNSAYSSITLELIKIKESLSQANEKYLFQVSEVVPKLKEEIKLNILKTKRIEDEYKLKIEQINQKKIAAELQVVKVRATLSFQIGYQIVHGFKTWKSTIMLPWTLWKIRKNFNARKETNAPLNPTSAILSTVSYPSKIDDHSELNNTNELPPVSKSSLSNIKDMRIACIMDEFTFGSYAPEAKLFQLTPEEWKSELVACDPDLLFIESAWRGKDDLWGNKVGHASKEVHEIVDWCRQHNIPTVFWNKEDPIHFETFLNTARLFDYVFTTDIDCIHRYKGALGHDRVYLLPFAAQPSVNNPIEKFERKDAFCFAGAYYVRYPDRTRDLGNFVVRLSELKPVEIYDRNYGKDDSNYQFPAEYQPFIVGNLPFEEIDKAYKGYNYAINLNSIKQSQTMFARRVYELLASNTLTISNFSRGVRLMFGDLIITSDNGDEIARRFGEIVLDETSARKHCLAALRKVMSEHTYADRLRYVVNKIRNSDIEDISPIIAMAGVVTTLDEYNRVLDSYRRQYHIRKKLYLVIPDHLELPETLSDDIITIKRQDAIRLDVHDVIDADFVACVIIGDYYGPNYLSDIGLATRYCNADIIGKAAHYVFENGLISLVSSNQRYRADVDLYGRACAIRLSSLQSESMISWCETISEHHYKGNNTLSIDEFNYCRGGSSGINEIRSYVDDLVSLDIGVAINDLLTTAERIMPLEVQADLEPFWSGEQLSSLFSIPKSGLIEWETEGSAWQVSSTLSDGKHEYVYGMRNLSLSEMNVTHDIGKLYFDTTPGLNLQVTLIFLDAQQQKISHVVLAANRNQEFAIPLGTESVRFGIRVYAAGSATILGIVWGHRPVKPSTLIGQRDYLVLTNLYPSYEDLYRNGFVHSRVAAYRERGIDVDVFRLRPNDQSVSFHEFHNVDVISGSAEALRQLIIGGSFKTILVHFLDEAMWEVLRDFVDYINIVVWVHGAEIQPWHRRDYNYRNEEERNDAKKKSDLRMAFWHSVLRPIPEKLTLVFVSRYFAEEVMEDIGFRIPEDQYTIIHNPIDTELFNYIPKSSEQRKRILSIRPYASAKYANDLSVNAVLSLKDKPFFSELEFCFIGDGPLFDEILAPLRELDNVTIERRFLSQQEIADFHKSYGIFLTPTRMDAQGVSRDEAMSSGLVPLTNAVAAIPEFVDETCGILADAESADEMAEGISNLYENIELFLKMSKAASERVKNQSNKSLIIQREMSLFVTKYTNGV
jgi:spore maturation protein CgeB/glycosyltransferase involved in cell wall biosynthesis